MRKLGIRSLLVFFIISMSITPCFATSTTGTVAYKINSINELKAELANIQNIEMLSQTEQETLIAETDPAIASEFVAEKMEILFNKTNSLKITGTGQTVIDLGDNCTATIRTTDVPESLGFVVMSSTPGATTLWKGYGDRMFTSTFEVRTGVLDVDLILVNHYTLSSKGITFRYGDSDAVKKVGDLDLGSASAGAVVNVKTTAYTIGQSIQISCTFTYSWAPALDINIITKKFKMNNYVKFSGIDTLNRQVKVVQSWSGIYL